MKPRGKVLLVYSMLYALPLQAQEDSPASLQIKEKIPARLLVQTPPAQAPADPPLVVPLPAHAARPPSAPASARFQAISSRETPGALKEEPPAPAEYFLPDRNQKPAIMPENSNLNLPADLEITAKETGETILLPAGTYRQILQLPIDSPLIQTADQVRRNQSLAVTVPKTKSRYQEPETKPVWVRYESLEKIKIGHAERRGGIDLPSHGPKELGPRVWYAKSETADIASSMFYFVFGGLGYSTANVLGWSSGNTREIPGDFEYRLIRK